MYNSCRCGGRAAARAGAPWLMVWPMLVAGCTAIAAGTIADETPPRSDPAAWGSDHVGQPLPEYVTGDECLFCHRTIGPTWTDNRHQLTVRAAQADDPAIRKLQEIDAGNELASQVQYLLGSKRLTRYLRRSKQYGKLDLLGVTYIPEGQEHPAAGQLNDVDARQWDTLTFAKRCAGCHATAVDTATRAFSATSLDCFTCHGAVDLAHTSDASWAFLSSNNREARQVISTCGQCHLRGGRSKSTGLPYPNTFVAGDNLLRDYQVDLSDAAISALPAIEQHIYFNARDVAILDRTAMTCLTCHDVHRQRSQKHQQLDSSAICSTCHVPDTDNAELRDSVLRAERWRSHSRVCDY